MLYLVLTGLVQAGSFRITLIIKEGPEEGFDKKKLSQFGLGRGSMAQNED
jgi:hypothetical protein